MTAASGALDATLRAAARVALVAPRAALLRARVAVRLDIPEAERESQMYSHNAMPVIEPFTGQNSEAHSTLPRSAGSISIHIRIFR